MTDRLLLFLCGLAAGVVLKGACDAMACCCQAPARARPHRVRTAGRSEMRNPPRNWDIVDEQGDESFPASDPPGNY